MVLRETGLKDPSLGPWFALPGGEPEPLLLLTWLTKATGFHTTLPEMWGQRAPEASLCLAHFGCGPHVTSWRRRRSRKKRPLHWEKPGWFLPSWYPSPGSQVSVSMALTEVTGTDSSQILFSQPQARPLPLS